MIGMDFKFYTKPWKHQKQALEYLMPRSYGALYTDMGSGKTKIMIDLILNKGFKRTIIVCPSKLCELKTWDKEITVHAPERSILTLNPVKISGVNRVNFILNQRKSAKNFDAEVLIVSYSSIWREPFKTYLLNKYKPDCIICDESHKIKTPGSKCSKMLCVLGRRSPNRFLMTGTPLGQSPLDIYAQYRFLAPEIFGTNYDNFKQQYANWVNLPGMMIPILDKKNPYKNQDELRKKMFSCAFAVETEQSLPPTKDVIVEFELSAKAQKYYKELRKEGCLELKKGVLETGNVLSVITRLQQLTSNYVPIETDEGEKKVLRVDTSRQEAFQEILENIPEYEPVVVFCKYRKDIKDVRVACNNLGRLSSELSGKRNTMEDWLKGKSKVLIIQISSGAEGLNDLIIAKYCIYYSLTHSVIQYKQSRKRVHRPGQTRPVTYYILVAKLASGKTIDEQILDSLKNNQEIINDIMNKRTI
jgi:SNF2 family DNA or RNA helicase